MAVQFFYSHSLNPPTQKTYVPTVSNHGSVLNDCPPRNGIAFGMGVQQTAPNNYLNTSNPYGESFHNPFNDYRFPKVLVRVLYHQKPGQSEPSGLSNKTKAQQSDENILYTSQSGFRIDRVWSMAVKANPQSQSINANHSPLDSTVKDTAGNGSSGMGLSSPQISTVVDNASQKAFLESEKRRAAQRAYRQSKKGKASRQAYSKSEKGKATRRAYRQSVKGVAASRAYEQSKRRKVSRRAYLQSEKGQAARKAYEQSEKGKATRKAYEQTEQRKTAHKAFFQSDKWKAYQKAYRKVINNTGDKEQAKIAGKQASAFIKESIKAKNSELESMSISPITPCPAPLRLTEKSIIEG